MKYNLKDKSFILRDERIAKGKWVAELRSIELFEKKGIEQNRISASKGSNLLTPENALYLIHKGELVVYFCDVILSLEECYLRFTQNESEMKCGLLYNFLNNYGYRLYRYPSKITLGKKGIASTNADGKDCREMKHGLICSTNSSYNQLNISASRPLNTLWKGSTKPLINAPHYTDVQSLLSSVVLSKELFKHKTEKQSIVFQKPTFSIKFHHKNKLKANETFDHLYIMDRHENFILKNLCSPTFYQENDSFIVGVDSESEFRFFKFSSLSSSPTVK